jgi:hypothetical protein
MAAHDKTSRSIGLCSPLYLVIVRHVWRPRYAPILETANMKPPLRIAILECDTPPPDVVNQFGTYGNIFKTLLDAGGDALDQLGLLSSKKGLELSSFDVVHDTKYPNLEDVDAVLISGSSRTRPCTMS